MNIIVDLFLIFAKIGLFTFGGGYGMISLIKEECVEKRDWVEDDAFINIIAVSESTPGPIAVNMATYIGFKKAGILGAISATLGVISPSIIILYIVSVFFKDLLKIDIIDKAFRGIRIAVGIIIVRSALSLMDHEIKTTNNKKLTIFLLIIFSSVILLLYLLKIHVNTLHVIIVAFILSVFILIYNNIMRGMRNDT